MKLLRIDKVLIILLMNLFISIAYSQEGSPFLTDFASDDESLNENYSLCLDKNGVLVIANRKGILTYDAEEWKLVKTPELPLIVAVDPNSDSVFVGCRNNVGYLSKNQMGEYEYISLAGKEAGTVVQIEFLNNYVYFLSSSVITRINLRELTEVKYWKSKGQNAFNSMFVLDDRLLIDVSGRGLQTFDNNNKTLFTVLEKFQLSGGINFVLPYDEDNVLIGASDNK
jgi:hypothetical protein